MGRRAFITGVTGTELRADEREFIAAEQPWGFILFKRNIDNPAQVSTLVAGLRELVDELLKLGVDFKGFDLGLVDFPCWHEGREICLCWKLGEPAIGFWHETWAGYAGRRPL